MTLLKYSLSKIKNSMTKEYLVRKKDLSSLIRAVVEYNFGINNGQEHTCRLDNF